MSGGIAYVLDATTPSSAAAIANWSTSSRSSSWTIDLVRSLIRKHVQYTGSELGARILEDWAHRCRGSSR
jgi:glutamate synthase domain-containing protein 3